MKLTLGVVKSSIVLFMYGKNLKNQLSEIFEICHVG